MPSVTDGGGPDGPALHPDAQAILDRGLPRWARSVLYVLGAAVAAFLAWASLARIDRVVVAHGRTVTTERPLVVQPFERGVVRWHGGEVPVVGRRKFIDDVGDSRMRPDGHASRSAQ